MSESAEIFSFPAFETLSLGPRPRIIDDDPAAVKLRAVQLGLGLSGALGIGHLDEPETSSLEDVR